DGEAVVGRIGVGLREDVLAARRVVDGHDHPLSRRALPGPPEGEALGRLTRLVRFKIEAGCRALREGAHRQTEWQDQTQQLESWLHVLLPPEISVHRMSPPFSSTPTTPVPKITSGSGTFLTLVSTRSVPAKMVIVGMSKIARRPRTTAAPAIAPVAA